VAKQKIRKIVPNCCANCGNRIDVEGYPECKFDSELLPDSEDIYYLVCNWFESTTKSSKAKKKKVIYINAN